MLFSVFFVFTLLGHWSVSTKAFFTSSNPPTSDQPRSPAVWSDTFRMARGLNPSRTESKSSCVKVMSLACAARSKDNTIFHGEVWGRECSLDQRSADSAQNHLAHSHYLKYNEDQSAHAESTHKGDNSTRKMSHKHNHQDLSRLQ